MPEPWEQNPHLESLLRWLLPLKEAIHPGPGPLKSSPFHPANLFSLCQGDFKRGGGRLRVQFFPLHHWPEMRDDNSRDQKNILQWPLHWVIPSKDGQFFSVFHWSLQAATSKAEKSEAALSVYPPSDWWPNASGRVVDNTKKFHHLKTAYHIRQQIFFEMISQTQAVNHQEQAYFMRLFTSFCGLGKHLEWVQCPRVQVGTKWRPFWVLNIPNSLRIWDLGWVCFLKAMIGSLQRSKLPWPGHDFQSWKLCSALSISKESFPLYLYIYIVTLAICSRSLENTWLSTSRRTPRTLHLLMCLQF